MESGEENRVESGRLVTRKVIKYSLYQINLENISFILSFEIIRSISIILII